MSDLDTSVTETEAELVVTVTREVELPGLDGSVEPRPVEREAVHIEPEVETAEAIAYALLEWAANGSDGAGPPEGKPIHDKFASMEPDR